MCSSRMTRQCKAFVGRGWFNRRIGRRDALSICSVCVMVNSPTSIVSCSTFLSSHFLPYLPVPNEVMQRGEQLFIPPPSHPTFMCDEVGQDKKNYTLAHHHHSEVKTPSSLITHHSSFTNTFLFSLRNMSIVRALYYII